MRQASTQWRRDWVVGVICIISLMLLMLLPSAADAALILRADHSDTPGYDVVVIDQQFGVGSRMRGAVGAVSGMSLTGSALTVTSSGTTANTADLYAQEGLVGFSGAIGDYQMNITSGMSSALLGAGRMDLFNVSFSGGTGTLTFELWDTSQFAAGDTSTRFHTLLGGTTDGLVEIATYADADADAFGTDYLLQHGIFDGSSTRDGLAFAADHAADLSVEQLAGTYAMGIRATITHSVGDVTSFDIDFQSGAAVPEPATALMAILLLLLSSFCRMPRRRCR